MNSYQFSECNAVNKGGQPEIWDPSERAAGDENQGSGVGVHQVNHC